MFARTFSIEHTKIMRRALPWVLLMVLAGTVLLVNLVNYAVMNGNMGAELPPEMVAQLRQQIIWPDSLFGALGLASGSGLGGFLVVILSGTTMAQEYTWRTLQQWLGRGVPRPVFLAAKFSALLLPILLLVLTPLLVGAAITALFTLNLEGGLNADQVAWGRLALRTLATAYTLLPYAALTFLLAVVTRSTVAAVGVGIAYSLLLEGVILQMAAFFSENLARLSLYLPAGLTNSLLQSDRLVQVSLDGQAVIPGVEPLAETTAVLGIALYTLLFLGLSLFIFRRQDLNES